MGPGLYRYVLQKSLRHQLALAAIIFLATGLALVPIELQKRIVNVAIAGRDFGALSRRSTSRPTPSTGSTRPPRATTA